MCINSNISFKSSPYDRFIKYVPNKDIKNPVKYNKAGQLLASPHWNRLALGITAITTQPWIDYYNPDVDRDTAKTSFCRTLAKIPVCTTVGFIVRGGVYKLTEKFMHSSENEGSTLFTPKAILQEKNANIREAKLKLHKNAFSTVSAIGIMLFTNFLIDAPLTTKFTSIFMSKIFSKEQNK